MDRFFYSDSFPNHSVSSLRAVHEGVLTLSTTSKQILNRFCIQTTMWATASTSSYAGTCIFLVVLGVILLFIVSSRSVLEKRWSGCALNRRHVLFLNRDSSGRLDGLENLLTPNGPEKDIIIIEQHERARRSWKTIMLKATMTTLILAILYIQMIFIMTENIGYILSILGGVFLGTLVMGRYSPRATDANLHHT